MATANRAALIARLQRALKKHYKPATIILNRPILEQLLLACLLEDAHFEQAEKSFKSLNDNFFDWNEVRVSTNREMAEVLATLPFPEAAATRLRQVLQSVFETMYSFDLEPLRKQNQGQAIKKLEGFCNSDQFVVAYVVQTALGGHSIPVDAGTLGALAVIGLITEAEKAKGLVPGLERAVPKSKGLEFATLLHQLGADFAANPYSPTLQKTLLEIAPDCKDRLPKRLTKKQLEAIEAAKAAEAAALAQAKAKAAAAQRKAEAAKAPAGKEVPGKRPLPTTKPAAPAKPEPASKEAAKRSEQAKPRSEPPSRPAETRPAAKKPLPEKKGVEAKRAEPKKPAPAAKRTPLKKKPPAPSTAGKRKPR